LHHAWVAAKLSQFPVRVERSQVLDLASVTGAALLVGAAVVFRFHLWQGVAVLFPTAPTEFAAAFAALSSHSQMVLVPLTFLTAIATLIVLLRQGTRSLRGKLRIVAMVALVALSLISTTTTEPLEQQIVAGATRLSAEVITPLVQQWRLWQSVKFGLAVVVAGSLVVAYRLPMPAPVLDASGLGTRQRTLLFLLGAATLFEGYDRFIVTLALPYIGKDLGASEGALGYALSLIRAGALLSIFLGRIADRSGRRRLLLFTVLAYTLATAATGVSRDLVMFVAFQLCATIFLVTELALAQVVIAEEFPADLRGRGQGMLGAFGALGSGVAAVLFPLLQRTPAGWRGLYFIGILPLLLIAYLRRALPETQRWERAHAGAENRRPGVFDVLQPALRLRFIVLVTVAACASMIGASAFGFASYRATNTFGWTPAQVSSTILTGGGLGFVAFFIFGRLVDQIGRRLVGGFALVGAALAVLAYYRTSWLLPSFAAMVFLEAGVGIAINSLGTELFPTALRATAKAWITNAGIIGAMTGLGIVGAASAWLGGADVVISLLTAGPILAAPLLLLLPETRGRELEAIEPETPGSALSTSAG
jgi:MFS family permease